MAISATTKISGLNTLFNQVYDVYYNDTPLSKSSALSGAITATMQLPVIEDSVTFNTGDVDKTEVKLTTGTVWASKLSKGDTDISFQVSSVSAVINTLFLGTSKGSISNSLGDTGYTWAGNGYALDVVTATGALYFVSQDGNSMIILPNVDMNGALVAGDGDNPSYYNVVVTPKVNDDGAAIYILNKTAAS